MTEPTPRSHVTADKIVNNPLAGPGSHSNTVNQLMVGTFYVCGLLDHVKYPEFQSLVTNYDILCCSESKSDSTDATDLHGFIFFLSIENKCTAGSQDV